jgi:hypothetical protein
LNALASSVDDTYNHQLVHITGGKGADQLRVINDYNGTTKAATVDTWDTTPDATSSYVIIPFHDNYSELATHGDANWGSSVGGTGTETVTIDYGGTNALQGVDGSGVPVECLIIAYLTSDYSVGNTGASYIQGRVTQYADGTWSNPFQLNVNTYTLVYYKDEYQVATQSLVVT